MPERGLCDRVTRLRLLLKILPTLDMWMREKRPNNVVVNDPKGELLVKNYVRATVRGFQVVQFNLINPLKTDIYNRAPRSMMKSHSLV